MSRQQKDKSSLKAIRKIILKELPTECKWSDLVVIGEKHSVSPFTIKAWVIKPTSGLNYQAVVRKPKQVKGATVNTPVVKSTNPTYMQIGDEVQIVEVDDASQQWAKHRTGKLEGSLAGGRVEVLVNGTKVICSKVRSLQAAAVDDTPKQAKKASRQFIRWVIDFCNANPELVAAEVGEIMKVDKGRIHSWKMAMRRNAHRYPLYTPEMSERWTKEYLTKPEEHVFANIDDELAAEETSRKYAFTEGNYMMQAEVFVKDGKISCISENEGTVGHNRALEWMVINDKKMDIVEVEALAKMMMGAVKMARKLQENKK